MSLAQTARLLHAVANPRPQPIARERFETFTITEGSITGAGNVHPRGEHDSLDAAIEAGIIGGHKSKFVVRQSDDLTGRVMLKFYAVKKKSKPVYRYHNYETRAVYDLYAEHWGDLREGVL